MPWIPLSPNPPPNPKELPPPVDAPGPLEKGRDLLRHLSSVLDGLSQVEERGGVVLEHQKGILGEATSPSQPQVWVPIPEPR